MPYQLTAAAHADILETIQYIETVQKNPRNARLVATRLAAHFVKIAAVPGLGHTRLEVDDPTARVSHVSGLLVIYDPTVKPLLILRVIHSARDLRKIDVRLKRG